MDCQPGTPDRITPSSSLSIPEEQVKEAFAQGKRFLDLPKEQKSRWPFNPDTYLGWRGPDELETVTGNRLWEWYSIGHFGHGGYDVKSQSFKGEDWLPENVRE